MVVALAGRQQIQALPWAWRNPSVEEVVYREPSVQKLHVLLFVVN
jgi:hypothetical protein